MLVIPSTCSTYTLIKANKGNTNSFIVLTCVNVTYYTTILNVNSCKPLHVYVERVYLTRMLISLLKLQLIRFVSRRQHSGKLNMKLVWFQHSVWSVHNNIVFSFLYDVVSDPTGKTV